MEGKISQDKLSPERNIINYNIRASEQYIWKNIMKVETLRKENSILKGQTLCKSLQIKFK